MFYVKSLEETKAAIQDNFKDYTLKSKKVCVNDALGYISSNNIFSPEDVPHFDRSVVDGYAVMHDIVKHAKSSVPVILKLIGSSEMGTECTDDISEDETIYVPTGGHIPKSSNAVVMIEDADVLGDEILINKSVSKWENVLIKASDIKKDQLILPINTLITPMVIGMLKALGINEIDVFDKLSVLIISIGDEITSNNEIKIGEIRDINTYTIKNYLISKGIFNIKTVVINDDFDLYKNTIIEGFITSDLIIASGGSSVGIKDYTLEVMKSVGAKILVHGINIKPGKPTLIAKYNNKAFIGLPGQPTSAYTVLFVIFNTFYHTIYHLGIQYPTPYFIAKIDTNINAAPGRRTYQLVNIHFDEEYIATPLFGKSGMINTLKQASGYIIIDEYDEGIMAGESVKVYRIGD